MRVRSVLPWCCLLLGLWPAVGGAQRRIPEPPPEASPEELAPGKTAKTAPRATPRRKPRKQPSWGFGLQLRMPILTDEPATFNPDVGIGVGIHVQHFVRPWFALRISVDHDRTFTRRSIPIPGLGIEVSRSQTLTSTSFLVESVFLWTHRWFSLHFAAGAGLYIAYWTNAEVEIDRKVDITELLPGARLEAGMTFRLHESFSLGLSLDYNFRRSTSTVPHPQLLGVRVRPFDDQMALTLRFDYLF